MITGVKQASLVGTGVSSPDAKRGGYFLRSDHVTEDDHSHDRKALRALSSKVATS